MKTTKNPAPFNRSIDWYHPLEVADWEFVEQGTIIRDFVAQPQEFVRILLRDATVILARRHSSARPKDGGAARLYGTEGEYGHFFSLSSIGFNEIKPIWNEAMESFVGGSIYPVLRNFIDDERSGGLRTHIAMYEIWHGKRDPECHVHHLNRDKFDYCEANLIQLEKRIEHREADRRQKMLAEKVPNLHAFTYERLRELQDPRTMPREEFEKQLALIPVFTIDPDCDRREPNKHYDPFCERDDPDSAAHLAPFSL